jgi:hypothetical protein
MGNVPGEVLDKAKTHIFFSENHAVYGVWKNMLQPDK